MSIRTIDSIDAKGKTIIVRVDVNSPLDPKTNLIIDDSRIRLHSETLNELADKQARVVVIAHQGRKGDADFTDLRQHSELIKRYTNHNVQFTQNVIGQEAIESIKGLRAGDILFLNNVRLLDEETRDLPPEQHAKGSLVSSLSPLANYFVNDAFAAAHRSHASIVGFTRVLPSVAGRVMERELRALQKVYESPEKPCIYVLGGAKPKETFNVIEHVLDKQKADDVLIGGMISTVFYKASGEDIGELNSKELIDKGFASMVEKARRIWEKYHDKIVLPLDVAVDLEERRVEISRRQFPPSAPIRDIGTDSVTLFSRIARYSRTLVMNGPLGLFENEAFSLGTVEFLRSLKGSSAYSVLGGGHSVAALEKYGLTSFVSYVSSAGGAMITYLSGEKLPGVEALRSSVT